MPDDVITRLEQVTPQWLTRVLSRSGALRRGGVAAVDVFAGSGNWSTSGSLKLHYQAGSLGELPDRLFLKMVDADLEDEFFGPSEVDYYLRDYLGVEGAPLLRCYDGAFSLEDLRYHLLLEDVSDTHIEAAEKEPTLAYGQALADGLAALHAHWWGARRLAQAQAPVHDAEHISKFVEMAAPGVEHILERFTGELEPHWPELMGDLFAKHPQALVERSRDARGFTLIHGDAGHNNILIPRNGARPIYVIDRQPFDWSLTTWLGVYDLAYAMVLDWETDLRRSLEIPVLRRYQNSLRQRGVQDYPWERLFDDYLLCIAMGVYIATEYCRGGVNERWINVWLPMLRRSLTAIDDLGCGELW